MGTSWQNELRKYWRVIENETEMLLTRDCIKDHMLFNTGFKNDLINTVHKRIADTYERFLDNTNDIREIALRNGFATNVIEQQNQKNEGILSENDISSIEACDTATRQLNQCAVLNTHDAVQTPATSSNERRIVWSEKLNCRNSLTNNAAPSRMSISRSESSGPKESVIVQNPGQQAHSTIDDILNVSLSQHSEAGTPETASETDCISSHDQTLTDLGYIICQAASSENPSSQNVKSDSDLDQLQKVLESCLGNLDIETAQQSVVDNTLTNAERDESRKIKLEQDLASETMVTSTSTGYNRNDDSDVQVIGSTDPHFQMIDLTLDCDDGPTPPSEAPSVVATPGRNLSNANESKTQRKKRKHVTFADIGAPGKKQKVNSDSNVKKQLNFDMRSIDRPEKSSLDNNRADNSNVIPYKCTICAKDFSRYSKLESHMKTHESDIAFRCNNCYQKFSRLQENDWKSHEKQCKSKQFECYVCKIRRRSMTYLQEHFRQHSGLKPFQCSDCPKCFASRRILLRHLKSDHKKGKKAIGNVKSVTK